MNQEKIPGWIKRGQELIYPEKYEKWERCVFNRVNDIYNGNDLDVALRIMASLEAGMPMEEVKGMFENLNLSGVSQAMVANIVFDFSSRGPEFLEATIVFEDTPVNKKIIEDKKQENIRLAQENREKPLKK